MKKLFLLFTFITFSYHVFAIPAKRNPFQVTQPDGTVLTLTNHGDEHFHYLTDPDGRWLRQNADGWYIETEQLTDQQIQERRKQSPKLKAQNQHFNKLQAGELPINLAQRGIIILVNFKDVKFNAANTQSQMQQMYSGANYTHNGATGSCRRYFSDQSSGTYVPQFDVVGPVTISNNMAYYGANNLRGDDLRATNMIYEACQLADQQYDIDFSQYDNDGDGYVDFVYVVYAGYSEASGAPENTVWPHAWNLTYAGLSLRLDGTYIDRYACSSELQGTEGTTRDGIGTFCHEFSHVLGLPDLYITETGASHKTLGSWDIMDYGPYNNDGNTPPAYSAYERFFFGWLTPTYINSAANLTLKQIQTSNSAYIVTTSGTPNMNGVNPSPSVFYMLENRQQTSWDTYLPGHGLMITKVSFDYDAWNENRVNNYQYSMGVDLIEAGGADPYGYDLETDLFPAGATQYKGITNRPITDIQESKGVISFKFMGGVTNQELSVNYAQGIYDPDYSSEGRYSWEIDLYNITTENYDYDLRMYFAFYSSKQYAISGSYSISDMDYAGLFKISGNDTTHISFNTCNATVKYIGNDSYGYPKYSVSVQAKDYDGNKYSVSQELTIYCWDYSTHEDLNMVDEQLSVTPVDPTKRDITVNFGQALYDSRYDNNGQYSWEIDLYNITDYQTNAYNTIFYFGFYNNSTTSIAGHYSLIDMTYAGLVLVNGTDTTTIRFSACEADVEYIGKDSNDKSVYRITASATDTDGNIYNISQELTIYCWDYVADTQIEMNEDPTALTDDMSDIAIITNQGQITVKVQGLVQIFDMAGHLLYSTMSDDEVVLNSMPRNQVLIVRAGSKIQKVIL